MTMPKPHTGRPRVGLMLPISEGQMEGGVARWTDILAMVQTAVAEDPKNMAFRDGANG